MRTLAWLCAGVALLLAGCTAAVNPPPPAQIAATPAAAGATAPTGTPAISDTIATTATTVAAPPATTPAAARDRSVTIWAPYFTFLEQQTIAQNADLVDEINFFWYELGGDGKIKGGTQSAQGLQAMRDLGVRVVPSIVNSGFSRDNVLAAIATPEARRAHIADIVALVRDNDYDGIDIDYESLAAEDREVFTLFIEELATALHAEGKLLSIAVHAKTDDAGSWSGPAAQDWQRLGAAVDAFKIMTYDYHWGTSAAGPIAPIAWVDEVLTYAATVVPPAKTYMGVHFYGYDWIGEVGQPLDWRQVQKAIDRTGVTVQRDESGEAWFQYDDGRRTVYFADAESVRRKLDAIFAKHPDLAGIAIWRLGNEDPAVWPAIRETINR